MNPLTLAPLYKILIFGLVIFAIDKINWNAVWNSFLDSLDDLAPLLIILFVLLFGCGTPLLAFWLAGEL